jgi:hypothetical protein
MALRRLRSTVVGLVTIQRQIYVQSGLKKLLVAAGAWIPPATRLDFDCLAVH